MKKNRMMRAASVLLIAVMLTTSVISGTFAKYVTSGTGTESARVAEFGVTVTASSDLFSATYDSDETGVGAYVGLTVEAEAEVVAPGTTQADATSFTVSGAPEVAVRVSYEGSGVTLSGWEDSNGDYYCPLTVVVNTNSFNGMNYASLAEFQTAINGAIIGATKDYAPNTNLSTEVNDDLQISWTWPYAGGTGSVYNQDDVKDTFLGDQAAAGNASTITVDLTCTVTQID